MREQIAVYGSGTIGSCEATLIIGHGVPCTVIGHSERGLDRCRNAVAQNWDDLIAEGKHEANKQAALALLTVTNDPAALKDHTFVFEAVTEGAAEKQAPITAIAQYAAQDAIIASLLLLHGCEDHHLNLTPCPERLLIAHPFQPFICCR